MSPVTLNDIDLERLRQLAVQMAQRMPAQLVVGLVGTLGAGKTTFTQALAAASGIEPDDVTSPTFTLLCSYEGRIAAGPIRLHHLDAYRLADEDEFLELGVDELFDSPNTWVLIEWADRVESVLPPDTLWLTFEVNASTVHGETPSRAITLSTDDAELAKHLADLATAMA